jgi:hypothetical protein
MAYILRCTAAYTPQQNGVAERANRTIKEKVRTLLLGVNADNALWNEAAQTAAYSHNVTPVAGKDKTPYEEFHGHKPDLSGLRKWGCLAYVKQEKHQTHPMGHSQRQACLLVMTNISKGYRVRVGDKVIVSRNVHFVEGKSGAVVLGRLATQPSVSPTVEECPPVVNESDSDEEEHDTTSVPAASPNPFQPLLDQDNNDAEEGSTSTSSSPSREQLLTTKDAHPSGSTAGPAEEPIAECMNAPPASIPAALDKLMNAAREPAMSYGPSMGTRARARNALRLMTGQPLFVKQNKGGRRAQTSSRR